MADDSQRTDDASLPDAEPNVATPDDAAAEPERAQAQPSVGAARGLALIALLLALGLGAAGVWIWSQQIQPLARAADSQQARFDQMLARADAAGAQSDELRTRHEDALGEMRQLRADVASRLEPLEQRVETLAASLAERDQQAQALTERVDTLAGEVKAATTYLGRNRGEWLVEEAEHLLTVAMQQAQLAGQPESAVAALDLADQSLRMTDDLSLIHISEPTRPY